MFSKKELMKVSGDKAHNVQALHELQRVPEPPRFKTTTKIISRINRCSRKSSMITQEQRTWWFYIKSIRLHGEPLPSLQHSYQDHHLPFTELQYCTQLESRKYINKRSRYFNKQKVTISYCHFKSTRIQPGAIDSYTPPPPPRKVKMAQSIPPTTQQTEVAVEGSSHQNRLPSKDHIHPFINSTLFTEEPQEFQKTTPIQPNVLVLADFMSSNSSTRSETSDSSSLSTRPSSMGFSSQANQRLSPAPIYSPPSGCILVPRQAPTYVTYLSIEPTHLHDDNAKSSAMDIYGHPLPHGHNYDAAAAWIYSEFNHTIGMKSSNGEPLGTRTDVVTEEKMAEVRKKTAQGRMCQGAKMGKKGKDPDTWLRGGK